MDNLEDGDRKNIKHLKSKKIKLRKKNINNLKSITKFFKGVDVVVHLAALSDIVPSINDPKNYLQTNIMGTMHVLESMRENHVKKIICSILSLWTAKNFPTKETDNNDTRYPYSF